MPTIAALEVAAIRLPAITAVLAPSTVLFAITAPSNPNSE
jgi:hypothetical protein